MFSPLFSHIQTFFLLLTLPHYTSINGRFEDNLYRCKICKTATENEVAKDLKDTTEALKKLTIEGITITIHNFPLLPNFEPPPPEIQVNRWLNQLGNVEKIYFNIEPISMGGFVGLKVEAENEETALLALSMQVDEEYKKESFFKGEEINESISSFTIKAIGPKPQIESYREEILEMMLSFELTKEFLN